jgi:5'(3')-deoxyribonucleotidase
MAKYIITQKDILETNNMIKKKILYVDMDDVLCDYSGSHKEWSDFSPSVEYPQSIEGFFAHLKPINMAIRAIEMLNDKFDVYILTAPSVLNPLCYTEKRLWVEKHLGMDMVKKLIITPNKALNKGDYLIDDNTSGRGQNEFEGELIHFGSEEFLSWADVLRYLYSKR